MTLKQNVAGATLLELLLVMAIMMTLIGLVGGSTIESVDRAAAQTEVISVYSLTKRAGVRAFASGKTVSLKFSGSSVDVFLGGSLLLQKKYEHLRFADQTVSFNRNGIVDKLVITVSVRGIDRSLNLNLLSNNEANRTRANGFSFAG